MEQILLVEDNVELAMLIQAFLKREGFSLFHVTSGEEALTWMNTNTPNLLLLDIMLPEMDGFSVCEKIRQKGNTPILLMSARYEKNDKLLGFELGADDYIEKPIDIDILCAKVKAILKRNQSSIKKDIIINDLRIDTCARIAYLHNKDLELNVKEYELLLLLVKNAGTTLHKEYLFDQIWGRECFSENQTLTVHIKMLRSKLEEDPKNPKRIVTLWGVGYRYEDI